MSEFRTKPPRYYRRATPSEIEESGDCIAPKPSKYLNTWSYFLDSYWEYSRASYDPKNPYFIFDIGMGPHKDENIFFFEEHSDYRMFMGQKWRELGYKNIEHQENVYILYENALKENPDLKETELVTPSNEELSADMHIDNENYKVNESSFTQLKKLVDNTHTSVNKMLHVESGTLLAVKKIQRNYLDYRLLVAIEDLEKKVKEIDHVNVVKFYGVLYRKDDLWVCSEFLETSLHDLYVLFYCDIEHKKPKYLPEKLLWRIVSSILKALKHLHVKLDFHCGELHIENVFISNEGEIKVSAFSGSPINPLHKILLRRNGVHIAPERFYKKFCTYEEGSDIWSLGIILLAAGCNPFIVTTYDVKLMRSQFSMLPSLSVTKDEATRYGISEQMMLFINKCLELDIKKRGIISEMQHEMIDIDKFSNHEVADYIKKLRDKALAFKNIPVDSEGIPLSLYQCSCSNCKKYVISDEI